jgi:hypothetical protein
MTVLDSVKGREEKALEAAKAAKGVIEGEQWVYTVPGSKGDYKVALKQFGNLAVVSCADADTGEQCPGNGPNTRRLETICYHALAAVAKHFGLVEFITEEEAEGNPYTVEILNADNGAQVWGRAGVFN